MIEITQEEKDTNAVLNALYGQIISIAKEEKDISIERTIEVFLRIRKNTDNMFKSSDWSLGAITEHINGLSNGKIKLKTKYIKP